MLNVVLRILACFLVFSIIMLFGPRFVLFSLEFLKFQI